MRWVVTINIALAFIAGAIGIAASRIDIAITRGWAALPFREAERPMVIVTELFSGAAL